MEMLDVFDRHGIPTGQQAPRTVVHRAGLWHQTFHCWVVLNGSDLLFQVRAHDKASYPGMLDISAAGHLTTGETVTDGLRELAEELGVQVAFDQLHPVGTLQVVADEGRNREHAHVFVLHLDGDLHQFRFNDGEVAGLVTVAVSDLPSMVRGVPAAVAETRDAVRSRVALADIAPLGTTYWHALLYHLASR